MYMSGKLTFRMQGLPRVAQKKGKMYIVGASALTFRMLGDCSDPRQEYSIPAGRHEVIRIIERPGTCFARPWLCLKDDLPAETGFPEANLRKDAAAGSLTLEDDVWNRVEFILGFGDATEQWVMFEALGKERPSFTRRQLAEHNIAELAENKLTPAARAELTEAGRGDIINRLLSLDPRKQYNLIGKLGLEYKLSTFTREEILPLID